MTRPKKNFFFHSEQQQQQQQSTASISSHRHSHDGEKCVPNPCECPGHTQKRHCYENAYTCSIYGGKVLYRIHIYTIRAERAHKRTVVSDLSLFSFFLSFFQFHLFFFLHRARVHNVTPAQYTFLMPRGRRAAAVDPAADAPTVHNTYAVHYIPLT